MGFVFYLLLQNIHFFGTPYKLEMKVILLSIVKFNVREHKHPDSPLLGTCQEIPYKEVTNTATHLTSEKENQISMYI